MSDTPRTDVYWKEHYGDERDPKKFCQKLERELAAAQKDQIQLAAAKYIVWSARWAFTKILSQGLILPHAEWEHFNEMLPQVEKWLVINDQVAVNFKEGAADLAAAIERPTESAAAQESRDMEVAESSERAAQPAPSAGTIKEG